MMAVFSMLIALAGFWNEYKQAFIVFVVFYLLTPYQLRTEPMGRLNVVESQGDGTTVYDNNDDKAVGP